MRRQRPSRPAWLSIALVALLALPAALASPPAPGMAGLPGAEASLPALGAGAPSEEGPCAPAPVGCVNVPFLVDDTGDRMTGPLRMAAPLVLEGSQPVRFPGGDLAANPALTFGERRVCLAHLVEPGCGRVADVRAGPGLAASDQGGVVTLRVPAGPGILAGPLGVAVDYAGTGSAPTAARSDHHHDGRYVRSLQGAVPGPDGDVALRAGKHVDIVAQGGVVTIAGDGVAERLACARCLDLGHLAFNPVTSVVGLDGLQVTPGPQGTVQLGVAKGGIALDHLAFQPLTAASAPSGSGLQATVAGGALTLDLREGGIAGRHLAPGAITKDKLAFTPLTQASAGSGLTATVQDGALSVNIADGGIVASKLAFTPLTQASAGSGLTATVQGDALSVDIADGGIAASKLAFTPLTSAVASGSAITASVAGGELTVGLADGGVGAQHLADGSVTQAKLAFAPVTKVGGVAPDGAGDVAIAPRNANFVVAPGQAGGLSLGLADTVRLAGGAAVVMFDPAPGVTFVQGEVVAVDPQDPSRVGRASNQVGALVVGVVEPGATLRFGVGTVPVASQGKVQVLVKAPPNGTLAAGDLLVPSNSPGVATKCALANGCPGQVLGKALQGYTNPDQAGRIWALLSLA